MEFGEVNVLRGALPDWAAAASSGSGSGYGDGYGDGYVDGDGYGDGYGYGYGDGYGYGYGDGSQYWQYALNIALQQWAPTQQDRLKELIPSASAIAFWKSDSNGFPANGGYSREAARPGLVEEVAGRLEICSRGLHATMKPEKWAGDRLWLVALFGEVQWQDDKCAALKREILGEVVL